MRLRPALVAVLAVLLTACPSDGDLPEAGPTSGSPTVTETGPLAGGTLYSFLRQPSSLDPGRAVEADDLEVVDQLFDSLTTVNVDLEVRPAAATSWEANPPEPPPAEGQPPPPAPATRFTFHLREGATFHDGTPVTAAAFERAWERIVHASSQTPSSAYYLLQPIVGFDEAAAGGELAGVTAVDDRTLQVDLSAPLADFPAVVSHPALAPVPEDAIDDVNGFTRLPVGNGPFRMTEPWQPGRFIRLEAYPDHKGPGRPGIDELVYRIYDGDDAVAAGYDDFLRGNLDVTPIPDGEVEEARETFGSAAGGYTGSGVIDGINLITAYYGFNTGMAPYDDPTVRQALSLLIDRAALADEVVDEGRAAATSMVPDRFDGYEPADCEACTFDPPRARELLAGRTFGPGTPGGPLELVFYEGADHEAVAQRVQRDVNAALGTEALVLRPLPQDEWLEEIRTGSAGFFLTGWLAEYPAVDSYLYPLLHASRIGSDNLTGYANPEVNSLLDRARAELAPEARADLYREAEQLALRDLPVLPLFHYRHSRLVSERVRGYTMTPLSTVDLSEVTLEEGG